ncbi:hypothetical protein J1N35_035582 [Gossypium stocksii]|uniref:Reverse transcriptase domain-containing protein n=1 Tax=Gossypium stocksii TaxID=47602 RepID=A0A9D3ZRL9_9ROSI|nr:hypothetical protein J1N35_035582 [Gossypium stocksii]
MSAIYSSFMQILQNGVPIQTFKPVRGIHQRCPLSPYLSMLCMDWLEHLIRSDIDIVDIDTESLAKIWPLLRENLAWAIGDSARNWSTMMKARIWICFVSGCLKI